MADCRSRFGALLREASGGSSLGRGIASDVTSQTLTVGGRSMRYIDNGVTLANGDLVVFLTSGSQSVTLGRLAA